MTIKGPTFKHDVIDVTSHSPLVQYFLQTHGLDYHSGCSLLIQHADITEQPDGQESNPTYRKIIRDSQEQTQQTKETFEK